MNTLPSLPEIDAWWQALPETERSEIYALWRMDPKQAVAEHLAVHAALCKAQTDGRA